MPVGQATMFSHYAYNAPSVYLLTYSYCSSHMLPFSLVHWCFVSTAFKNFPASLFTHSDQERPCAWKLWTFYNFFPKVAPLLPCLNDTWGDEVFVTAPDTTFHIRKLERPESDLAFCFLLWYLKPLKPLQGWWCHRVSVSRILFDMTAE